MVGGKRIKFGSSGGSAAQKLAVDSFHNIANSNIGGTSLGPSFTPVDFKKINPPLASILALLASSSMTVGEIGQKLPWNSDQLAEALRRGGEEGLLSFLKEGEKLLVTRKSA